MVMTGERPIFTTGIRQGQDIHASSAFYMEYLVLTGALFLQKEIQTEKTYTDCQLVYKILYSRQEDLNNTDKTHRVLLQTMDGLLAKGLQIPGWVPIHVEK